MALIRREAFSLILLIASATIIPLPSGASNCLSSFTYRSSVFSRTIHMSTPTFFPR